MTLYNETNEYFEQVKKTASETDYTFIDDVVTIKYGGYALAFQWEYISRLLDCFVDTEDFDIREDLNESGVFYIQGRCGKAQKKKFERFIATGEDE